MAQIDLSRKYSNFFAPQNQISINSEDLQQKYGITTSTLNVEQAKSTASKFAFTIDDPQAKWINTSLFEPTKTVEMKMGYGTALEMVTVGEVTAVKSIFSSSGSQQIEVSGESKTGEKAAASMVYSLVYGKTLLSFTATVTATNPPVKTATSSKTPGIKTQTSSLHCTAECIGLPEIKPGTILALSGLGSKFNQNCTVEKAVHIMDKSFGYRTRCEAKMQPRKVAVFRPNF